mmetsp:Transcript_31735/g.58521  ORF Transcript_31735/g.58521 Transcript_31735/m.58521 type:complete len:285 (+) Transcript_31735:95-949(+)
MASKEIANAKRSAECLEDDDSAVAAKGIEGAGGKRQRLDSAARRRSAVRKYQEMVLTQAGDVFSGLDFCTVFQEFGDLEDPTDVGALVELQKKMQSLAHAAMKGRVRCLISDLWEEYTADKDGYMSAAEGLQLLTDCIDWYQKHKDFYWEKTWDVTLRHSVEHTKVLAKLRFTSLLKKEDPDISEDDLQAAIKKMLPSDAIIRWGIRASLRHIRSKCPEIMDRSIESHTTNMEDTTRVFLSEMDKNHDGNVDKAEFQEHFMTAIANTIGADKIIEKLTQEAMRT